MQRRLSNIGCQWIEENFRDEFKFITIKECNSTLPIHKEVAPYCASGVDQCLSAEMKKL